MNYRVHQETINNEDIIFKLAAKENAKEIHSLMESVHHRLEDKSLFLCDDLAFVENHIENEGFTVIACHKDAKIVGSFIFRYPMQSDDNLGRDIGLQDHRLEKVVHMESVVVLPEFRGRGLQLSMLQYGEKLLEHSKFEYLMATVSPDNIWSHHSFEKNGCKLMATKEKYHGLMRRIYFKQLKKS